MVTLYERYGWIRGKGRHGLGAEDRVDAIEHRGFEIVSVANTCSHERKCQPWWSYEIMEQSD